VSDSIYVVESGSVRLAVALAAGGEEDVRVVGAGHWFGEIGPMLGLPRSASAYTLEPSVLTAYGLQEFRRWRASAPDRPAAPV
jgi:putative ABC transport system ATP-binding protein